MFLLFLASADAFCLPPTMSFKCVTDKYVANNSLLNLTILVESLSIFFLNIQSGQVYFPVFVGMLLPAFNQPLINNTWLLGQVTGMSQDYSKFSWYYKSLFFLIYHFRYSSKFSFRNVKRIPAEIQNCNSQSWTFPQKKRCI